MKRELIDFNEREFPDKICFYYIDNSDCYAYDNTYWSRQCKIRYIINPSTRPLANSNKTIIWIMGISFVLLFILVIIFRSYNLDFSLKSIFSNIIEKVMNVVIEKFLFR